VNLYTVVLTVSFEDAIVSFPLEVQSHSIETAQERIAHWQDTLCIPPPV